MGFLVGREEAEKEAPLAADVVDADDDAEEDDDDEVDWAPHCFQSNSTPAVPTAAGAPALPVQPRALVQGVTLH